jgi:hypothetical protein
MECQLPHRSTRYKKGMLELIEKLKITNKSIKEIIDDPFEQEHSDAVICAKENYNSWINLIILDILVIQDAYKKLTETNDSQKYQQCCNLLKEDIEILNNKNENMTIKISDISESNWHLVELTGHIEETLGILEEQHQQNFSLLVNEMKMAVHNFFTNNNIKNIKDFKWAEMVWNKSPQEAKYQILYNLDNIEEEGPNKEWLKA